MKCSKCNKEINDNCVEVRLGYIEDDDVYPEEDIGIYHKNCYYTDTTTQKYNTDIDMIGDITVEYLNTHQDFDFFISQFLDKCFDIIRTHDGNYTIQQCTLHIKYGQPLKLKVYVNNIRDKDLFYGMQRYYGKVLLFPESYDVYSYEHLLEIKEW